MIDPDIILRDRTYLVFFPLAAWLSFRHAKLTADEEARA